jgi:hypothetical protein
MGENSLVFRCGHAGCKGNLIPLVLADTAENRGFYRRCSVCGRKLEGRCLGSSGCTCEAFHPLEIVHSGICGGKLSSARRRHAEAMRPAPRFKAALYAGLLAVPSAFLLGFLGALPEPVPFQAVFVSCLVTVFAALLGVAACRLGARRTVLAEESFMRTSPRERDVIDRFEAYRQRSEG